MPSSSVMEKEPKKEKKIDGNAIVSPVNTRRLYGEKPLDQDEAVPGQSEEVNTTLPDAPDDTEENMFPSAP